MGYSDFTKVRNAGGLFYPSEDFTYGEFLAFLDGLQMPCCCSMIHDSDKYTQEDVNKWVRNHMNPKTGKLDNDAVKNGIPKEGQHKNKHVHFMLCANGPMTPSWFLDKIAPIKEHCSTYFIAINSVPATMRYYAHMDSPEKHQYSPLDIHSFGGLDMSPLMRTSKVSNLSTLVKVMDYIMENGVSHYHTLVHWALNSGDVDLLSCVSGRASFFAAYFKSKSDDRIELLQREVDKLQRENKTLKAGC